MAWQSVIVCLSVRVDHMDEQPMEINGMFMPPGQKPYV